MRRLVTCDKFKESIINVGERAIVVPQKIYYRA